MTASFPSSSTRNKLTVTSVAITQKSGSPGTAKTGVWSVCHQSRNDTIDIMYPHCRETTPFSHSAFRQYHKSESVVHNEVVKVGLEPSGRGVQCCEKVRCESGNVDSRRNVELIKRSRMLTHYFDAREQWVTENMRYR